MKMEDAPQDAQNAERQPTPEAPTGESFFVDVSIITLICSWYAKSNVLIVDQEESEDEGPPPGWDSKCQPKPMLQKAPQSGLLFI